MLPSHLSVYGATDPIAIQLLEHPESYPGLRPLDPTNSVLRLSEVVAIDGHPMSVWFLQMTPTSALVRRVEWWREKDQCHPQNAPHTFGADADLPTEAATALLEELRRISIPSSPPDGAAIDGATYTIEHGREAHETLISWQRAPAEWREVAVWFDRARDFFEQHLPLSTTQSPHLERETSYRPAGITRSMLRYSHRRDK